MTPLAKVDERSNDLRPGTGLSPKGASAVTAKRAFAQCPAEFIQDPDYTEHPSRSASIALVCAALATGTVIGALLFGGLA